MLVNFVIVPLVAAGLAKAAYDSSPSGSLPPCNAEYRPCRCSSGSTFKNLTSYGIIGAAASDVQSLMGKFLDIRYQGGLVPASTTGKEFTPGATRTFNFSAPAPGQFYQITEVLLDYKAYPDGSFLQANSQSPKTPVVKIPGGGTYMGQWSRIIGQQTLVQNETAVAWHNWRCETGETFPAAQSHETGIQNASDVLGQAGKHTGVDVAPFTIFHDLRQD